MNGLAKSPRQLDEERPPHSAGMMILLAVLTSVVICLIAVPAIWAMRSPLDAFLVSGFAFAGFLAVLFLFVLLWFGIPGVTAGILNGLPIVIKELLEQSARRRTWWLRSVYALLAFFGALSMSVATLHRNWTGSPFQILGQGSELFIMFVSIQFFGIYLFMPAMTSTLITSEKERDSLSLLFLTRLSPWGIIIGKLVSRLVPMFLLLALSMPLYAFAYSLGGFEQSLIWRTVWILSLTVVQVATLGLMCSAFCRTTVGAFILTYVLGFFMLFGPVFANEITGVLDELFHFLQGAFGTTTVLGFQYQHTFSGMFFAPMVLFESGPFPFAATDIWLSFLRTVPIVILCGFFLLLTRLFIVSRAFIERRNLLLIAFRKVDRIFWELNNQFARGVVLTGRSSESLPDSRPVAWRETTKKTFGTARYLVRIFIGLEFPILFLCSLSVGSSGSGGLLSLVQFIVWIIATLLICVSSASLFSAERTHQTLEVLLTTPLTNRDLLLQKMRGVLRLTLVVAVPLLTVYGFEAWLRHDTYGWNQFGGSRAWRNDNVGMPTLCYLLSGVLTMLIYFPMLSALSILAGLKLRTQTRAIFATLGIVVGWCLVPLIILGPLFEITRFRWEEGAEYFMLSIPAVMIVANEFREFNEPWAILMVNSAVYGVITVILWMTCLRQFDKLLGRFDSPDANVKTQQSRPGLPPLTATTA